MNNKYVYDDRAKFIVEVTTSYLSINIMSSESNLEWD